MARSIDVLVYHFVAGDPNGGPAKLLGTRRRGISVDNILALDSVNVRGGMSVYGLPMLYGKITLKQPGLSQELFVIDTVQDLLNKENTGN